MFEAAAAAPAHLLPEPLTGAGWNREPADRDWLVDGWLPAGELSLLAGPGSVGKSLLALQLGAALACDRGQLLDAGGWLPSGRLGARRSAGTMRGTGLGGAGRLGGFGG